MPAKRNSPPYLTLLVRTLAFVLCASALWSLLPLLARWPLEFGPTGYGITLGAVGIGAGLGTTVVPEMRRRYGENLAVAFGSSLFGAGLVVAGLVGVPVVAIAALAAVGFGWINVTSNLNATAQPDRAREFAKAMQPVGGARQQTGATRWALF